MNSSPISSRRRSLGALAALGVAGATATLVRPAQAQAFPARPIKLVVPHAPGRRNRSCRRVHGARPA